MRAWPQRVHVLPVHSVSDGNNAARELFSQCWFNEATTAAGLQGLRHYRYRVIDGQLSAKPLHDPASDIADGFRTMAMARREGRDGDAKGHSGTAAPPISAEFDWRSPVELACPGCNSLMADEVPPTPDTSEGDALLASDPVTREARKFFDRTNEWESVWRAGFWRTRNSRSGTATMGISGRGRSTIAGTGGPSRA